VVVGVGVVFAAAGAGALLWTVSGRKKRARSTPRNSVAEDESGREKTIAAVVVVAGASEEAPAHVSTESSTMVSGPGKGREASPAAPLDGGASQGSPSYDPSFRHSTLGEKPVRVRETPWETRVDRALAKEVKAGQKARRSLDMPPTVNEDEIRMLFLLLHG
jgi:hypothetical protein